MEKKKDKLKNKRSKRENRILRERKEFLELMKKDAKRFSIKVRQVAFMPPFRLL